jgi:beta-N-acetylhexosaminidase
MHIGPLIIDISGTSLTTEDTEILQHPLIGGVILFSSNYESLKQLIELTSAIHKLREPKLLVCVDHEGGRVQRFRDDFTSLPPVQRLQTLYDHGQEQACEAAHAHAWVMAAELKSIGVDLSFAPVVDINYNNNSVMKERMLHANPEAVASLSMCYVQGMNEAGMESVAKHFPGHGFCESDSHEELPIDERSIDEILSNDLVPFCRLIDAGISAIMTAHIVFPQVDAIATTFSSYWLQTILRKKLNFRGAIISDDLNMQAANSVGDYVDRSKSALNSGCDALLLCNNRNAVVQVLDNLRYENTGTENQMRLSALQGQKGLSRDALEKEGKWLKSKKVIASLEN